MANTIILKKSSVGNKVPLNTDLVYGELAVNYTDGRLYYKTSNNTIDYIANGGTFTNALIITSTTNSASTTTGALQVAGGVGIGSNLYTGGLLNVAGNTTINGVLIANELRNRTGQQLVLNAGESHSYATVQGNELVYINAEAGLEINSSPDNWVSGWAGRYTTSIGNSSGNSSFPNAVSINGTTNSVSTTTGALVVTGGVGIGGDLYVGSDSGNVVKTSYETVNKNLRSFSSTLGYSGTVLTSIVYTTPAGIITKTLNYSGTTLISVVLSGATPGGISLTKTITYIDNQISNITYS